MNTYLKQLMYFFFSSILDPDIRTGNYFVSCQVSKLLLSHQYLNNLTVMQQF